MKVGEEEEEEEERWVVTSNEDLCTLVDVDPAPLVFVLVSETWEFVCRQDYKSSGRSVRFVYTVDKSSIISLSGQDGLTRRDALKYKGGLLHRAPHRLLGGYQSVLAVAEAFLRSRSGRRA